MHEVFRLLKILGFTEYEARVFYGLFSGELMAASEIAKRSGVRRTDVYPILRSFVERGYCNEIETNSVLKYQIIEPDIIVDKLESKIRSEKDNKIKTLKDAIGYLKEKFYKKGELHNDIVRIQLIRGYNKHRESKFVELLKSASKEILFMIRVEMVLSDEIDQVAKEFLKKGGIIKSVYEIAPQFKVKQNGKWVKYDEKEIIKVLKKYVQYGEQVRVVNIKVPNMTVCDREVVFLNINDKTIPRHNEADLVVRNKDFAESMANMFLSIWNIAKKIKK